LRLVTDPNPTTNAEPNPSPSLSPAPHHRPTGAVNPGPVLYKGEPLEPGRGPGLGCFRFQVVVLVVLVLATPLSVGRVPDTVTAILLFATLGVLLVSGQTMIFLLRLVAAERRDRREPLSARSPTVGQIENAETPETPEPSAEPSAQVDAATDDRGPAPG
jgi:hypothetical protein